MIITARNDQISGAFSKECLCVCACVIFHFHVATLLYCKAAERSKGVRDRQNRPFKGKIGGECKFFQLHDGKFLEELMYKQSCLKSSLTHFNSGFHAVFTTKMEDPQSFYWPGSEYTSTKSPATMEKSASSGKLWGLTSGNLTGRVWSEDFLLLLYWWIQGYTVREFTCSHLKGAVTFIRTVRGMDGFWWGMRSHLYCQTNEWCVLISFVIIDT